MKITRRATVAGLASTPVVSSAVAARERWDVVVVGAGVFGAWTAEQMRRRGKRVLLVDAWGPAHARASSGGESRLTRAGYGRDAVYSRMALEALDDFKKLSRDAGLPIFHEAGVLSFYDREMDYATGSFEALRELNIPVERIEPSDLKKRWPQIDFTGVAFGQYEPSFGALMARRGVATLVENFVRQGGAYLRAAIAPPKSQSELKTVTTSDGDKISADTFVFACGPWLGKLFPELLGPRLFATRQEILYFQSPAGDKRFTASQMPGWIDFVGDKVFYGFPDLESRGFKIADDSHGPIVDFDKNDRMLTAESLDMVRSYMAGRFPAMADAPLSEARICQYENSANGDFLIDRHPEWSNTLLVGMGSGHGFKHGPAVGRIAADLLLDGKTPDRRFSLATKDTSQNRSVH
ncbi:MAG: FAD-dependent oxidoreductase [Pseudomonadota bacterium]